MSGKKEKTAPTSSLTFEEIKKIIAEVGNKMNENEFWDEAGWVKEVICLAFQRGRDDAFETIELKLKTARYDTNINGMDYFRNLIKEARRE